MTASQHHDPEKNAAQRPYGPNSGQVISFLKLVSQLDDLTWSRLEFAEHKLLGSGGGTLEESRERVRRGQQPWLDVLALARSSRAQNTKEALDSAGRVLSEVRSISGGRAGSWILATAASALVLRPYVDEALFAASYGPATEAIPEAALGPSALKATAERGNAEAQEPAIVQTITAHITASGWISRSQPEAP